MEQYLASVGESLAATQKEKDALVASLTAQKDTFPSMTPHSLILLVNSPLDLRVHPHLLHLFPCSFLLFSRQADQVPYV